MSDSQPRMDINPNSGTISNTPRILELDINRMMIGQNTIRYCLTLKLKMLMFDWSKYYQVLFNPKLKMLMFDWSKHYQVLFIS